MTKHLKPLKAHLKKFIKYIKIHNVKNIQLKNHDKILTTKYEK